MINMNDYMYFAWGSTIEDEEKIKAVFKEGLISKYNSLSKSAIYLNAHDETILDECKNLGYATVFILRIPRSYINPIVINNQIFEIPLPIWKKQNSFYIITHELIYGAYCIKYDYYIQNELYKKLHTLKGLVFDKRQIDIFNKNNLVKWMRVVEKYNEQDYDSLINNEKLNAFWDDMTKQYHNYYEKHKNR